MMRPIIAAAMIPMVIAVRRHGAKAESSFCVTMTTRGYFMRL